MRSVPCSTWTSSTRRGRYTRWPNLRAYGILSRWTLSGARSPTALTRSLSRWARLWEPVPSQLSSRAQRALLVRIHSVMGEYRDRLFVFAEGGKTGITAITTGLAFLVSVFFSPVFASIPSWATGGALVIVGTLMIRNVRDVNWDYIGDAIPAILTIVLIPLTYKYALYSCTAIYGMELTVVIQHRIWCHWGRIHLHPAQWYTVAHP